MTAPNTGVTHQLQWDPDHDARGRTLRGIWDVMQPGDVLACHDAHDIPTFYDVVADPKGHGGVSLRHVLSGPSL